MKKILRKIINLLGRGRHVLEEKNEKLNCEIRDLEKQLREQINQRSDADRIVNQYKEAQDKYRKKMIVMEDCLKNLNMRISEMVNEIHKAIQFPI